MENRTSICNNINLQIGNSTQEVEKACGKPPIITKTNLAPPTGQVYSTIETTEWKYEGSPDVTLIFENGKLKERK